MIFFSNDLALTLEQDVTPGSDARAWKAVNSSVTVRRWLGDETLQRSTLQASTVIAAYNRFMNGVDRVDQKRAIVPKRRKKQRLCMSLFTWLLDLCIHNAYSLYETLRFYDRHKQDADYESLTFEQLKREIMISLVRDSLNKSGYENAGSGAVCLPEQQDLAKGTIREPQSIMPHSSQNVLESRENDKIPNISKNDMVKILKLLHLRDSNSESSDTEYK